MSTNVTVTRYGNCGVILFDRPTASNALTSEMFIAARQALDKFSDIDSIEAIMLAHTSTTDGFCSGCDVKAMYRSVEEDGGLSARLMLRHEADLLLALVESAPVITIMDGVTFGTGTCLALAGSYRIATEKTKFAVRECLVGLAPGAVTAWHFARLPANVGKLLTLTGRELDGPDCMELGIATHYIPSDRLRELRLRMSTNRELIGNIIDELATPPPLKFCKLLPALETGYFIPDALEDIWSGVANEHGMSASFMRKALRLASPTSAKAALRQLAEVQLSDDVATHLQRTCRIRANMLERCDFRVGHSLARHYAAKPAWAPATPEEVDDEMVVDLFVGKSGDADWCPQSLFPRVPDVRFRPHRQIVKGIAG